MYLFKCRSSNIHFSELFIFLIKIVRIILPAEMNFPPMYIFEYQVDALPECVYSDSTLSLAQLAVD